MMTNVYGSRENPEFVYAIVRTAPVGRERGFFPARIIEGGKSRKRVAPSVIPVREKFSEAHQDLENYARQMGWKLIGTMEVE
jgi:hypothetical protein